MSEEAAVAELVQCAGTQFDPVVIDAFVAELGSREPAPQAESQEPLIPAPAVAA
jgi:response regulator RpfG family c-di-GMP phosphodiesterase